MSNKGKSASFVLLTLLAGLVDFPQVWSAADPCTSNPCGKGAECHLRSNLAVCICPTGTSGDPFELCVREGETTVKMEASTSSSSTHQTTVSTSHPSTSSYSHGNTANHFRVTYESPDGRTSTPVSSHAQFTETSSSYPSSASTRVAEVHRSDSDPPRTSDNNDHVRPYEHHVTYEDSRRNTNNYYGSYRPEDESPRNSYDSMRGDNYHSDRAQHGHDNRYNDNNDYHRRPIQGSRPVLFEPNNDRRTTYESGNFRFETDLNRRGQTDRHVVQNDDTFDNNYYVHNNNKNNGGRIHMDPLRRTGDGDSGNFAFPATPSSASSSSYTRDSQSSSTNVKDPLGRYKNCITVRGVVVCAEESEPTRTVSHHPSSNHHVTSSSPSIFRDDHEFRREQNTVKFADRLGVPATSSSPSRSTYGGHPPEGTVYQEFVLRSDDQRPLPVDHLTSSQKSSSSSSSSSDAEQCRRFCGVNSVCRNLLGRPICGCPEGYTGDASIRCVPEEEQERMKNRCEKHTDCAKNEICKDSQCTNPCYGSPSSAFTKKTHEEHSTRQHRMKRMNHFSESRRIDGGDESRRRVEKSGMCGENTKCEVVGHTPLCGCLDGFTGNPYFGCVPVNNNSSRG